MKTDKVLTKSAARAATLLKGGHMIGQKRTIKSIPANKKIILTLLFGTSIAVAAAGAVLAVLSIVNNVSFKVFQSQIPGSVFGLVVTFLGVRYFMSVLKLKPELLKEENHFSWNNFRKENRT